MTDDEIEMTAELAAELAASDRRVVDPRTVPWRMHHLRAAGRSPRHALHAFASDGDGDESLAMRLGSGCHAMLLGKPWVVFDLPAKKGKGRAPRNGEQWEDFKAEHAGKVILSPTEQRKASAMADAIKRDDGAYRLLLAPGILHEQTILWQQDGRARRSTPDARGECHVVELKTARTAEPVAFARQALYEGYYAQLSDQMAAIQYDTGMRPWDAWIVAVESEPPHVVQVYRLTDRAIAIGERQRVEWFRRLCLAVDTDDWTGYSATRSALDLDPPAWAGVDPVEAVEP